MATIEWLGTGSGLDAILGDTSLIIRSELSDRIILIDCGKTIPFALAEKEMINKISDIVITHLHGDHFHGLETLGFEYYFNYHNRPNLHLATESMANEIRKALGVSMGRIIDHDGREKKVTLDHFFNIIIGKKLDIFGLPYIHMLPKKHVGELENYAMMISDKAYYSGNTTELPPVHPDIIFQDCHFSEIAGSVHTTYNELKKMPSEVKSKTYLVHLSPGWQRYDIKKDGFAGIVMPGDKFTLAD